MTARRRRAAPANPGRHYAAAQPVTQVRGVIYEPGAEGVAMRLACHWCRKGETHFANGTPEERAKAVERWFRLHTLARCATGTPPAART